MKERLSLKESLGSQEGAERVDSIVACNGLLATDNDEIFPVKQNVVVVRQDAVISVLRMICRTIESLVRSFCAHPDFERFWHRH